VKGIIETGSSITGRIRRVINRDVFVFTFFLLLAFIFWYLNSLDKEVETGIRYNIKYTNVPRGRTVIIREPERLNLYLKGTGSSVLRQKLARKVPITIDISKVNYKRVPGSKGPEYFVVTSGLTRSFSVQLRSEFEITSVKPDTLFFLLQKAEIPENKEEEKKMVFMRDNTQSTKE
jgi:hypothetical protein